MKRAPKPPYLGPRLQKAFRYAAAKHAGQTRKQTAVPYLSHLMAVTALVLEAGGDEDLAIAALLHDVVEDCGGMPRLREIHKMFGARVAKIVEGCTDSFSDPKLPWIDRKEEYLKRLKHEDADTRLVSASDKLYNARAIVTDLHAIGRAVFDRFTAGQDGTLWYYGQLSRIFRERLPGPLSNEIKRTVDLMSTAAGD